MAYRYPDPVDVLIIGSGPCGMAAAHTLARRVPAATILVVEVGPALSGRPGENVRNLPEADRALAYARAVLPSRKADTDRRSDDAAPPKLSARPGTHLVSREVSANGQDGMPAAAIAANVGGMGALWTCACPRPGGTEIIPFLDDRSLDTNFAEAEALLSVTVDGFQQSAASAAVLSGLLRAYPHEPDGREPQPMPLACQPSGSGGLPHWSGADTVLGDATPSVTVRAGTLCRRLETDGDSVTGAELHDLESSETVQLKARYVVVAADALRTPQLLWASDIRPQALGRYLNDQPQVVAPAYLDVEPDTNGADGLTPAPDFIANAVDRSDARDSLAGVCWVPFSADHPFHGQVMQLDASPIAIEGADTPDPRPVVGLGWFTSKELRAQDRVTFSSDSVDAFGMPSMRLEYSLSENDLSAVEKAKVEIRRVASELGELVPGVEPVLLPAGSSLHYQGSVRMGPRDDGTSVCDINCRVWGIRNLYVAGNGVIPTATACNPTLTSVALTVRAMDHISEQLGSVVSSIHPGCDE